MKWRELCQLVSQMGLVTRLIKMDALEVCERIGVTVHGVLVDQLSPAKESRGKAGAKYFEGKLTDWKKILRSVTFELKLLSD